jgi:hypothetical protein
MVAPFNAKSCNWFEKIIDKLKVLKKCEAGTPGKPQIVVSFAVQPAPKSEKDDKDGKKKGPIDEEMCNKLNNADMKKEGLFPVGSKIVKCVKDDKVVSHPDEPGRNKLNLKPACQSTCALRRNAVGGSDTEHGGCGCFCECMAKEMVFAITSSVPFIYKTTENGQKTFTSKIENSPADKVYTIDSTGKWSVGGKPVKSSEASTLGDDLAVAALLDYVPFVPKAPDCREEPGLQQLLAQDGYRGDAKKQMDFCMATEVVKKECTEVSFHLSPFLAFCSYATVH